MKIPYPIIYPRTKSRIVTRRRLRRRSRIVSLWCEVDAMRRILDTVFIAAAFLLGVAIILLVILGITLL
jgi:hypothetical protein